MNINKYKFVRDLVYGILDSEDIDRNYITDILIDDDGNCIHVTISGWLNLSTILAIGDVFGDDDPNIYGAGGDKIKIVMINEKIDELKDY